MTKNGGGPEKTGEDQFLRLASDVLRIMALPLTALVAEIDASIAEMVPGIDALERAYVHGAHGVAAGNPTVLQCLSKRRLSLETARHLRAIVVEVATDLDRSGGGS